MSKCWPASPLRFLAYSFSLLHCLFQQCSFQQVASILHPSLLQPTLLVSQHPQAIPCPEHPMSSLFSAHICPSHTPHLISNGALCIRENYQSGQLPTTPHRPHKCPLLTSFSFKELYPLLSLKTFSKDPASGPLYCSPLYLKHPSHI